MPTTNQYLTHDKNLQSHTTFIIGVFVFLLFFIFSSSFAATVTYQYDALNRLQTANSGNGYLETYTYDGVGNRTSLVVEDVEPPTANIASNQIIITDGEATISGTASDLGSGIYSVEISFDGTTWYTATGTTNWSFAWTATPGTYNISIKVTDNDENTSLVSSQITVSLQTFTLTVSKSGNGTGVVTSSPSGINCGYSCATTYTDGDQVVLTASPDYYCFFSGWSGCDSVNGNTCTINMIDNRNSLVSFVYNTCSGNPARILSTGQGYATIQAAYDAAISGDTIQVQALLLTGSLTINRDISVTISGGYSCDFSSNSGNMTGLIGKVQTLSGGGTVTLQNLIITNQ